jgi:aminopeptidase-like protein
MTLAALVDEEVALSLGPAMHALMGDLAPLRLSLTGDGVRSALGVLSGRLPMTVHEVPSGTEVYDWTVPDEWTLRDAFVATDDGTRVVDLTESPLHVVGYSVPFEGRLTYAELLPHLHTLPEHPDWIPYRTAYYSGSWGFCLSQHSLDALPRDTGYHVVVDAERGPGSLTYGECLLPGESDQEVLLSTHVCHPGMANDNLSGIALLTALGELLADVPHRLTYRLVFVPGTIGSLTWLSRNEHVLPRIRHGLVVTGVGGPGPLVYKRTRHGDRTVDRAAAHVVELLGGRVRDFSPWGYDERQYNSPGFDLPVGRLTRTPHGEYPEYHTSADDLGLVRPQTLAASLDAYLRILDVLESDARFVNLAPKGEPQLGKRGLYPAIGGKAADERVLAMLWTLNMSDGSASLLDVARRSGLAFGLLRRAAEDLQAAGLLARTT